SGPSAVLCSFSVVGSSLLIVTAKLAAGATPLSVALAVFSRFWPTVTESAVIPAGAMFAVTVLEASVTGVKPLGVCTVIVAAPVDSALKDVDTLPSPGLNVTVPGVTEPALVLLTVTDTDDPS